MKRILVLMSTYNGHAYLREQVLSILRQQCSAEVKLRIRDDGSTDDTCEQIMKLSATFPGRIELFRGENIGYNASFFALMEDAEGYDYYALSDQDDVWQPDKLQRALSFLEKEDASVPLLYACTSVMTDKKLKPIGETRKKKRDLTLYNTQIQNICPGHNQVMNEALLKKVRGPWDIQKIYVYDLWIANTAALYGKILFDNTPHTYYRQHESNELGSKAGRIGKLIRAGKRAFAGDGEKNRKQMAYFAACHKEDLQKAGAYDEIERFLAARSFRKRSLYLVKSRLYRQSRVETAAFRLAVWLGKY